MKHLDYLTLICFFLLVNSCIFSQIVEIPDPNFKFYLVNNPSINTNNDNEIQITEAEAFDGLLQCPSQDINSLVGIGAFINVTDLRCFNNNLTELDLSNNTKLERLLCYTNNFTSIDISMLEKLEYLNVHTNQLTELDVSNNTDLNDLYFQNNFISTINLTNCTKLKKVIAYENTITSIDVSNLTDLSQLSISGNPLVTIDIGNNPLLSVLKIGYAEITELDLSKNEKLTYLECNANHLNQLDLSMNKMITFLDCSGNGFESIDLDSLQNLKILRLNNNQLTILDLSHLNKLNTVHISGNQLTSLNIANGNNEELLALESFDNHDLACIRVDNIEFANNPNWTVDEHTEFSTDCSMTNNSNLTKASPQFSVFPNPVSTLMSLSNLEIDGQLCNIYDNTGKLITSINYSKELDVSNLTNGLYYIEVIQDSMQHHVTRFIKIQP